MIASLLRRATRSRERCALQSTPRRRDSFLDVDGLRRTNVCRLPRGVRVLILRTRLKNNHQPGVILLEYLGRGQRTEPAADAHFAITTYLHLFPPVAKTF